MKRKKISKNVTLLKEVLIVLCFVAVVIFLGVHRWNSERCLSWNFTDFAELIQIFILSITAYIALNVYASNVEVEELKMLIKLRELLASGKNQKIHQRLESMSGSGANHEEKLRMDCEEEEEEEEEDDETDVYLDGFDNCDVFNYLGTLELCKIILEHDVISTTSFRNQFGYRVENVAKCESIVKQMDKDRTYWDDFFELLNFFPNYKRLFNKTKNKLEK